MPENTATDRELTEVAQSLEFMAEDFQELSEKLDGQTRHDYLGDELRAMHALRSKLKYNIRKLEKMTGQSAYTERHFPF